MKQTVLRWTVGVIAILITVAVSRLLPPVQLEWVPAWHVIMFVPVMAIVNAVIGPIIKLLSLPINCMTFGLFSFVINAVLFYGAGRLTGARMNVWGALFGSLVYATLCTILSWRIKERRS